MRTLPARSLPPELRRRLVVIEKAPARPTRTAAEKALARSKREALENLLLDKIRLAGLPEPERQYQWARGERRLFRSDGAYPEARVLLEVQGGIWASDPGRHNRGSGYERDCSRDNLAALLGWKLLRFTERMIRDGEAVATIRRALGPEDAA